MNFEQMEQKILNQVEPKYVELLKSWASLRSIIEDVAAQRKDAEKAFSRSRREITGKSMSSINIFDFDAQSRVSEIVHLAESSGRSINSSCMRLIERLDTKCSMLWSDTTEPAIAEEIAKECHVLIEASDVSCDFSGSFQGTSFDHVGTIKFEPTRDSLRIEAKWELIAQEAKKKGVEKLFLEQQGVDAEHWNKHRTYVEAVKLFGDAKSSYSYSKAQKEFRKIQGFRDAD